MNEAELGTLEEVALRAAWNHEAHGFTPWLAEHLDRLSAEIGVRLELQGREVAVSEFSADILARSVPDGSLVLIENQLEQTDHTHLGQLLTYLAGLEAQIVIWIAAGFREAHLSAINWLNEHTADPFAFFAVRVKLVRIGDSPLAPVFEVLARPNEWDRRLQAIAQESREISELGRFRRDFWAHYAARHPGAGPSAPGYARSWIWRPAGPDGLAVVQYLAQREVGVFVRGQRGSAAEDVYERLAPHADQLRERLGADIGSPSRGQFFAQAAAFDAAERDNWDRMVDWLHETAEQYEAALTDVLGEEN